MNSMNEGRIQLEEGKVYRLRGYDQEYIYLKLLNKGGLVKVQHPRAKEQVTDGFLHEIYVSVGRIFPMIYEKPSPSSGWSVPGIIEEVMEVTREDYPECLLF